MVRAVPFLVLIGCTASSRAGKTVEPSDTGRDDDRGSDHTGAGGLEADLWFALPDFIQGADLSFTNEMEACGATFTHHSEPTDPFSLFAAHGHSVARVRLWHTPGGSGYSNLDDVLLSSRRAKEAGMAVLLDFHYSDTWADPGNQQPPAAWADLEEESLQQAVYDYTQQTLRALGDAGVMPEMVQVGNEVSHGMLWPTGALDGTDASWQRLAGLLTHAARAVRDTAPDTRVMLHLHAADEAHAVLWHLRELGGFTDYDDVGLSYYPWWSPDTSLHDLSAALLHIREDFGTDVMVVETAYPWTSEWADDQTNIVDVSGWSDIRWPATPDGQAAFFVDLHQAVLDAGGVGVLPWAPDWVSTPCESLVGPGSPWENLTFFDFEGASLPVLEAPLAAIEPQVVVNPGFEAGDTRSWTVAGDATIDWETPHSGWAALRLAQAETTIRQAVGVEQDRTYTLSAAGRTSGTGRVVVGIWQSDTTPEHTITFHETDYAVATTSFTAKSDTVVVYAWRDGTDPAWVDDLRLIPR